MLVLRLDPPLWFCRLSNRLVVNFANCVLLCHVMLCFFFSEEEPFSLRVSRSLLQSPPLRILLDNNLNRI